MDGMTSHLVSILWQEGYTRKEAGEEVGEEAGERKPAQITLLMVGQEWVKGSTTALQGFVIGLVH